MTRAWLWRNSSRCDKAIEGFRRNWSDSCFAYTNSSTVRLRDSAARHCINVRHAASKTASHAEFFAEIEPPHVRIVDDVVRTTLHQHLAGVDDVGPVGEAEGLTHIVIGD